MNIIDKRSKYLERRTPVEDIIATIQLENGKMVVESYTPTQYHRLLTSDGVFQLEEEIEQEIIKELERQM